MCQRGRAARPGGAAVHGGRAPARASTEDRAAGRGGTRPARWARRRAANEIAVAEGGVEPLHVIDGHQHGHPGRQRAQPVEDPEPDRVRFRGLCRGSRRNSATSRALRCGPGKPARASSATPSNRSISAVKDSCASRSPGEADKTCRPWLRAASMPSPPTASSCRCPARRSTRADVPPRRDRRAARAQLRPTDRSRRPPPTVSRLGADHVRLVELRARLEALAVDLDRGDERGGREVRSECVRSPSAAASWAPNSDEPRIHNGSASSVPNCSAIPAIQRAPRTTAVRDPMAVVAPSPHHEGMTVMTDDAALSADLRRGRRPALRRPRSRARAVRARRRCARERAGAGGLGGRPGAVAALAPTLACVETSLAALAHATERLRVHTLRRLADPVLDDGSVARHRAEI